jgi:AmmeMemoRadiSam system protein A
MPFLSEPDRRALLDLARRAIAEAVLLQKPLEDVPKTGIFAERRGAFVTIHIRGRLRGCIGIVEPNDPLGEIVAHCAAGAALHDPRFSRVVAEELSQLQIEISLLSATELIPPANIEIGRHGLLVCQGPKRGLLLPQVAIEHKLTREEFLDETCRKASLPPKSWQDPATEIYGFTCEVFSDEPRNDASPALS